MIRKVKLLVFFLRKRITASGCCVRTKNIDIKEIVKYNCIKLWQFNNDDNL